MCKHNQNATKTQPKRNQNTTYIRKQNCLCLAHHATAYFPSEMRRFAQLDKNNESEMTNLMEVFWIPLKKVNPKKCRTRVMGLMINNFI